MNNEEEFGRESMPEHTLVCLSASPSNAKIVKTAAKMVSAFGGNFTALYVRTPDDDKMDEASKKRLQNSISLAEQYGADVITTYGSDVAFQIAEFARVSGVTKIVIGRSKNERRHFWNKPTLTEKLSEMAPAPDIHIIPDNASDTAYRTSSGSLIKSLIPHPKDLLITFLILSASTLLGLGFFNLGFTDSNIITVYILGVLVTALFTKGYICGIIASLMSVMLFNFIFTEPRLTFHAYDTGYAITFGIMLIASIITSTLASKLKMHAKLSAQTAFRTKVLLDTDQLLQKARDDEDIINITATQLSKLFNRSVVVYIANDGKLTKGSLFPVVSEQMDINLFTETESDAAKWVCLNRHRAGATTDIYGNAKCLYLPVCINNVDYGVVGIHINGKIPDSFENDMLLSILGECALALDNNRNAKEKEKAAIIAKNEQLRANLLRTISHDLRTPLTSISGSAENLITNSEKLDEDTKKQIYSGIRYDSQWLISLVENLLSVTRIEEDRMNLNMSLHLIDDVIEEAMRHISGKSEEHEISVSRADDLLFAKMDAKLIIQVIVNLVDNAIKYTPAGSHIQIAAEKRGDYVAVSVTDDGDGIPDQMKEQVFEMFYTGENKIADSRRSIGLGLALCKSIVNAHGGEIILTDNDPHGCVFTFTLLFGEVKTSE